MDVENTHPFCLPFGFCHDATSSSVTTGELSDTNNDSTKKSNTAQQGDLDCKINVNNNNNNHNNHNDKNNNHNVGGKKTESLGDNENDLFSSDDLDSSECPMLTEDSYHSLELNFETIVEHSSSFKSDDVTTFNSHDDNDDENPKENQAGHSAGDDDLGDDDDDEDSDDREFFNDIDDFDLKLCTEIGDSDWYSNYYTSLFSSSARKSKKSSKDMDGTKKGGKSRRKKRRKYDIDNDFNYLNLHHQDYHLNVHHHNHHEDFVASENQVFQSLLLDTFDIKSSPTLAQLNLNSNEDNPDALWAVDSASRCVDVTSSSSALSTNFSETPSAATCTTPSISSNVGTANHLDLFSTNCTSISINHNKIIKNRYRLLQEQQQQQQQQHQHHLQRQNQLANLNGNQFLLHNNQNQSIILSSQQNNQNHLNHQGINSNNNIINCTSPSSATYARAHQSNSNSSTTINRDLIINSESKQGTLMGPIISQEFRKPDLQQQQIYTQPRNNNFACHQQPIQHTQQQHQNFCYSNDNNNGSLLTTIASANSNLLHEQPVSAISESASYTLKSLASASPNDQASARCGSPAQVTSSSSPLNSSITESRHIDNKLKENIDYLTSLICNGPDGKLIGADGSLTTTTSTNMIGTNSSAANHQTSSSNNISTVPPITTTSTMARSYSTLTETLSTCPKMLERPQQHHIAQNNPSFINQSADGTQRLINGSMMQSHSPYCLNPCNMIHQQQQMHLHSPNANIMMPMSKTSSICVAADSTDATSTQSPSYSINNWVQQSQQNQLAICNQQRLPSCNATMQQQHQQQLCSATTTTTSTTNTPGNMDHSSQFSEMKVLSTLLKSNPNQHNPGMITTTSFNPSMQNNHIQIQQQQQYKQFNVYNTQTHQQPPPGMMVSNSMIASPYKYPQATSMIANNDLKPSNINSRGQQVGPPINQNQNSFNCQPKIRTLSSSSSSTTSGFVQPASPSASSTASLGTSQDAIGSSSSSLASKRQKPISDTNKPCGTKSKSNKATSKSSIDSSSSPSHDEGFSSQLDGRSDHSSEINSAESRDLNDDSDGDGDQDGDDDDDDDVDSDDESFYGDYTNSDLIGASISDNPENKWTLNMGRARRNGQKRYFWQYNVQSKGPKGTRISQAGESENPFVLSEASDPVFSNDCQIEGVKHSGKARRGDGNDLTPNPRKLLMIGLELKKLSKIINDLAPVVDLPLDARNKTRKEKNKLASRACRLKKKAQHEANKIKLFGLQREHHQVVEAIFEIRKLLNSEDRVDESSKPLKTANYNQQQTQTSQSLGTDEFSTTTNNQVKSEIGQNQSINSRINSMVERCSITVAGQTSDFVNSILEKVVSGRIEDSLEL